MKILFLTPRFPYPLEKGDKLRAYHQLRVLSEKHEVTLVSIVDEEPSPHSIDQVQVLTRGMYLVTIRPADRWFSLCIALFRGLPFQVAWYYSRTLRKRIADIITEVNPDHIYCQLPRMAEYVRKVPVPRTLDYMDSFGIGMLRRASVAGWPSSIIYRWEAARMLRYEEEIASDFDSLTIISEQDKQSFTFAEADRIHVVRNGIDAYFLDYKGERTNEFDLVFVGNLSYLPNIETAEFLVQRILPLCPPKTRLLLAGASPDPRVRRLAGPNVTVSGWLEDIRTAYCSAKVFMAPMWSGTGQQNKILEAMALGIPCITTPIVNNAIGAASNREILLADTPESFAKAFQHIVSDASIYQVVQSQAYRFVRENFSWEQNGQVLSSIFAKTKRHGAHRQK